MKPSSEFIRKLEALDGRLFVGWNPRLKRYEIHRKKYANLEATRVVVPRQFSQMSNLVLRVENEDGGFKMPDNETLSKLQQMDTWKMKVPRGKSAADVILGNIKESEKKVERERDKKIHELNEEFANALRQDFGARKQISLVKDAR